MHLREIIDQATWDAFVGSQSWASFSQAWSWGEFQASQGHVVRRFFVEDGSKILLACQLLRYERRFLGYWFAPRGPVFGEEGMSRRKEAFRFLLEALHEQGLPGRSLFWRFEPILSSEEALGVFPLRLQRRHFLNPACTHLLDLTKTEEELLAAMHQKTRYNIRLASKHGVTVREGEMKDLEAFLTLMKETATRDEFLSHGENYLRATYETLASSRMARLRLAERDGKVLAANMEIWFGDTATYLHGASASQDRQVMAPYLLQWEAIRAAKAEGKRYYDFWGTNPVSKAAFDYKTSLEGVTRFKQGFGGEERQLAGTWELPIIRWLYHLLYLRHSWK